MSNRIKEQLNESSPDTQVLSTNEFAFLKHVTDLQNSYNYYMNALKTEFLHVLAVDHWEYDPDIQLEFNLDLSNADRRVTIVEVKGEPK